MVSSHHPVKSGYVSRVECSTTYGDSSPHYFSSRFVSFGPFFAEVLSCFFGVVVLGNKKVSSDERNEGVTTHNNGLTPGIIRYNHAYPG